MDNQTLKCDHCGMVVFEWPKKPEDFKLDVEYAFHDQITNEVLCRDCYYTEEEAK